MGTASEWICFADGVLAACCVMALLSLPPVKDAVGRFKRRGGCPRKKTGRRAEKPELNEAGLKVIKGFSE